MIIIFNVLLLFYGYMHLYSLPQPLPNCVSSFIIARVCVFSKQHALVFAVYLHAVMFFLFYLFLFSSLYLLCCPRASLVGHLVVQPCTSQQRH